MITKELLHSIFLYKDGNLYRNKTGKLASVKRKDGYKRTCVNGKRYLSHRIIFMMFYGYMPKYLDHIDGNPSNNNIENLREATPSQNQWNKPYTKMSNVVWHTQRKKWQVKFKINNKQISFGLYKDVEEAILLANKVRKSLRGEFLRGIKCHNIGMTQKLANQDIRL